MLSRVLLFIVLAVLVWSGIHPADRFTWWLEVAPVLIGLPIVILTNKRFPLTPLLQVLLTARNCPHLSSLLFRYLRFHLPY